MPNKPDFDPAVYDGRRTPALERLASVAQALGDKLRARVVFIGGSILPLLETERDVFGSMRPTKDVDAVVVTANYTQKAIIEEDLRALRFRHDTSVRAHADRWLTPQGAIFDLVSCGDHLGGNGSPCDAFAVDTAIELSLPPTIRHASAVGFLTLKCGAFRDRGEKSPLESKDLMDIVALAATRGSLVDEVQDAPDKIRAFLGSEVKAILASPPTVSAIPSHVADRDPLASDIEEIVMTRLGLISSIT